MDIAEIVKIKFDLKYVPHPRSVHSLVRFFDLTERIIFDLSNGIAVNNMQLQDAANRFLAHSPDMAELSHEECVAMTELVKFLGTQAND